MRLVLLLALSVCGPGLANAGMCGQSSLCHGKCRELMCGWFWCGVGTKECDKSCVPGTCCPGWRGSNCDVRAEDGECLELDGKCQDDSTACSGEYKTGMCDGGKSRRCCLPRIAASDDSKCVGYYGTCQDDSLSCPGEYVNGFCAGPKSRRCCFPHVSFGDDSKCLDQGGECQEVITSCPGAYKYGLCAGHISRRCCLPQSTPDFASGPGECAKINLITRSQWGARSPKATTSIQVPVDYFFVHHTAGPSCYNLEHCKKVVRGIQNYHMDDKGWDDIAYSFLVGEDGNVYEGRGWTRVGAHTKGYNSKSFAVSFMGNYMTHIPGALALAAAKHLIDCGVQQGKLVSGYRLYGHRDVGDTTCPGNDLYKEIQKWPHYAGDDYAGDNSGGNNGGGDNGGGDNGGGGSSSGDDSKCHAEGGKCQKDSLSCSNGCYKSKLCSGDASRRCCVPFTATGDTACNNATAQQYACKLLQMAKNKTIGLWKQHASKKVDNAYAYNNLDDACKGLASSRSKYTCRECSSPGAPGGDVCISFKVLQYLYDLQKRLKYIHVNEVAGACHSCCSQHYRGRAVDLHNKPASVSKTMVDLCNQMGGWGDDEGSHVHCQFKH